jgi:hypothetical protein
MSEKCFACGKILSGKTYVVITEDGGQLPWVGPDCYKQVKAAGDKGWVPTRQHGKSGPRLFLPPSSAGSKTAADTAFKRVLGLS